jgi:hypothetical protein
LNSIQHERARPRMRLTLSQERWDRSKRLQQAMSLTFGLSTLGAVGNWYNWLHGTVSLYFPLVLTVIAVVSLAIIPRKWQLLTMVAAGLCGLGILGTALGRAPLRVGIEATAATGAAAVICACVDLRLRGARARREPPSAVAKGD